MFFFLYFPFFPQLEMSITPPSRSPPNAMIVPVGGAKPTTSPKKGRKPRPAANGCVKIKDPAVKGNVLYDIELEMISPTQGLREHQEAGREKQPHHRACICKLWMEGRCGQGAKCKSFHVDPDLVRQLRRERGVVFDDSFISEIVVQHSSGAIFAARYNAATKTKGLDLYKNSHKKGTPIVAQLCPQYNPPNWGIGTCHDDRNCMYLHIKPGELTEGKQRTPCCCEHGDRRVPEMSRLGPVLTVADATGDFRLNITLIAPTLGSSRLPYPRITSDSICGVHIRSRCKFGRGCVKVHVCREWASRQSLTNILVPDRTSPCSSAAVTPQGTPSISPIHYSDVGITPGTLQLGGGAIHPAQQSQFGQNYQVDPHVDDELIDLPHCPSSLPPLMDNEDHSGNINVSSPSQRKTPLKEQQPSLYGNQQPPDSFEIPTWDPDTVINERSF